MATKKNVPSIGAGWVSVTDLRLAVTRARENRERQVRLLDNLNGRVTQRREEVERSLADIPSVQRGGLVNRAVSTFRAQVKRESADARLRWYACRMRKRGQVAPLRTPAGRRREAAS